MRRVSLRHRTRFHHVRRQTRVAWRDAVQCRLIRTFTTQNTGVSGRNRVWLKFTASGDKPHALMVEGDVAVGCGLERGAEGR